MTLNKSQIRPSPRKEFCKLPSEEDVYDKFHQLAHYSIIYGVLFPFYHLKFKTKFFGLENIPDEPVVVASNHYSYYDPTIISLTFRRPMAYIAKKELFDSSALSKTITFLGAIPINREKPGASSLKQAKKAFAAGWSVGIFIEGTRNKTRTELSNLEQGAAFFAKLGGGLPVVPMGIRGGQKAFDDLHIHVGKPIEFDKMASLEEMTLRYGQAVADLAGLEFKPEQSETSS